MGIDMARARNIKPAFFVNESLAELDPIDRLAFIGLWTIADFKGCIEYRPKRIKMQILPYDNCDFETIAINLDNSGFIKMYSVNGERYIKIINFERHQNPHKNEKEKGSDIPDYNPQAIEVIEEIKESRKIAINQDKNGTARADSLLLIPESLNPITDIPEKKTRAQFIKPSLIDIENHMLTKGLNFEQAKHESNKFYNYYESNGWKVGKNKMANWKASASGWLNRSKDFNKPELNLNSGWENVNN
jgi:hypothetical protein